jgi:cell division protein ZipA
MQANWSLILNVLLLIGAIVGIGLLMKARRKNLNSGRFQPSVGQIPSSPYDAQPFKDDIIAVRKINQDVSERPSPMGEHTSVNNFEPASPHLPHGHLFPIPGKKGTRNEVLWENEEPKPQVATKQIPISSHSKLEPPTEAPSMIMMFLLAKDNRQFAGYELLQTLLAVGLRFGEGQLFHRHQFLNGQGPVLCSLAAATASGIFDLQNIGAFSVRGLCLFMQASKNPNIDAERFSIMLETGRQLSEGLDAHLLDDQRKPLTTDRIERYKRMLQIHDVEVVWDMAQQEMG